MVKRGRSWQIQDGALPGDLRTELEEDLRRHQVWVQSLPNPLQPPWALFPSYERRSMGWRMGAGEDYLRHFRQWYVALNAAAQAEYRAAEPEPDGWGGFYDGLR